MVEVEVEAVVLRRKALKAEVEEEQMESTQALVVEEVAPLEKILIDDDL